MFSCFWHIPDWTFVDILGFVWDAAKAAVPAGVAWVAYKVSIEAKEATQAQRDIAANQYLISLYEVRRECLDNLTTWINENKNTKDTLASNSKITSILESIENTYSLDLNIKGIEKQIEDVLKENLREAAANALRAQEHDQKSQAARELGAEAALYRSRHAHFQGLLVSQLKKIAAQCRAQLKVPDRPYNS